MNDDLSYALFMLFAGEGETAQGPTNITHIAALVGKSVVAFCGSALERGGRARGIVDCMTCLALRDRYAAETSR